jgi:hypothetical protein
MAYANSAAFAHNLNDTEVKTETKGGRGIFRRLLEAMIASRARQAENEIRRYLATRSFNDELEREIERRFLSFPPFR